MNAQNPDAGPDPDDEKEEPETAKPNPVALNGPSIHVDDFVQDMGHDDTPEMGDANYARWLLLHWRLPAYMASKFQPFIQDRLLFCTYGGKRYRCTGASRMGDVWLTSKFEQHTGYELRVDLAQCTAWSAGA